MLSPVYKRIYGQLSNLVLVYLHSIKKCAPQPNNCPITIWNFNPLPHHLLPFERKQSCIPILTKSGAILIRRWATIQAVDVSSISRSNPWLPRRGCYIPRCTQSPYQRRHGAWSRTVRTDGWTQRTDRPVRIGSRLFFTHLTNWPMRLTDDESKLV